MLTSDGASESMSAFSLSKHIFKSDIFSVTQSLCIPTTPSKRIEAEMRRFINYMYYKNLKPEFHQIMKKRGSPGVDAYGFIRCYGTWVHQASPERTISGRDFPRESSET